MSELADRIEQLADFLCDQAEEADTLGHLPDRTPKALREAGIVKVARHAHRLGTRCERR